MLKDGNGTWIDDENELKKMVVEFFQKLYQSVDGEGCWYETTSTFLVLEQDTLKSLGRAPLSDEIKQSLFSMGPYKAPGFDGFPPLFFQSKWSVVGEDLCNFVKSVFTGRHDLKDHNRTLISLIPKIDRPESVGHLRPISLCSVHYKVLTKVIAGRLRHLMDSLVSPNQSSFIKG
ncbi:hypothetical protein QN277_010385 [Acacia crassicarpa]|uniref:Reverse transcriptase domain-containing protein n=1 Tax=Acacia crassicarpa TaxID=499986 RepID=A0AAE1M6L7_9FABA|nr:hypothetical protein QN277_010385 [Acacia crassicarpa]